MTTRFSVMDEGARRPFFDNSERLYGGRPGSEGEGWDSGRSILV